LTTDIPSQDNIADDAAKLNIVAPDFKENPATFTSIQDVPVQPAPQPISGGVPAATGGSAMPAPEPSRKQKAADKAKKYAHEAEDEGHHLWDVAKQHLLRPGVAGGLLGVGMSFPSLTRPYIV
jgi:hypothetical protein